MSKVIMSGNEAVARGIYEAGCTVAAAYPGTPSTEIMENVANYKDDIYCHWAANEKVSVEIIAGASFGGSRVAAAMKHVGMNVAADPLFTVAYMGVRGGMVFVTADDPGCHSSQNEQDNRLYAPHAKIAMIEPSDSAECKEFTKMAYDLSERFDGPIMIRMTTRVCHSKGLVELGEREEGKIIPYEADPAKLAMLPAKARMHHPRREKILLEMEEYGYDCPFNRVEYAGDRKIGIITSGISYMHAREVFGDSASYLKLGLTYPLPNRLIKEFGEQFDTLYVIEENDPYLENAAKVLGLTVIGKERIPICGELNAQIVREALLGESVKAGYKVDEEVPGRPPVLCAGCPHRGFFHVLNKNRKKIVPIGDIGCYSLGVQAPLNGFDLSIDMGAGISATIGMAKALEIQGDTRKVLGMVGDSTFFHSGLTSLIDVMSTQSNVIACILDNSITAMTGHQENPGTSVNLMGQPSPVIDIEKLVRAIGFTDDNIRVLDPLDVKAVQEAFNAALAENGPFVIITKRPCALIKSVQRANAGKHCKVDPEKCVGCKACLKMACPAMALKDGKSTIADPASCTACGLCQQLCKFGAIEKVGE